MKILFNTNYKNKLKLVFIIYLKKISYEYYKNKIIFLTGGTGSFGKAFTKKY